MSDNLPALPTESSSLSLPEQVKSLLKTPDDCTQYGKRVVVGQTVLSWQLADLLSYTKEQFGIDMAIEVGHELGYAPTSVRNYIKVAEAFPPDTRIASLSFSHHFAAATVDELNKETGELETNKRFELLEKAHDEGLSVRDLKEKIYEEKKMEKMDTDILPCQWCNKTEGQIFTYAFYSSQQFPRRDPDKFEFHQQCYFNLLQIIYDKHGEQ